MEVRHPPEGPNPPWLWSRERALALGRKVKESLHDIRCILRVMLRDRAARIWMNFGAVEQECRGRLSRMKMKQRFGKGGKRPLEDALHTYCRLGCMYLSALAVLTLVLGKSTAQGCWYLCFAALKAWTHGGWYQQGSGIAHTYPH